MPTGYTDPVGRGEVTEFADYAWACARAFGALVMMRDEPPNAKIPEGFHPTDRYEKSIAKAQSEITRIQSLTEEACLCEALSEHEEAMTYWRKAKAERDEQIKRYESMLSKCRTFTAPSSEHKEYAAFLVSQLEESIKFDSFCMPEPSPPTTGEVWRTEQLASLRQRIAHDTKCHSDELERVASRNRWLSLLREAIEEHENDLSRQDQAS